MDLTVRDRITGTPVSPRRPVSAPSTNRPAPAPRASLQLRRTQVIPPHAERPP